MYSRTVTWILGAAMLSLMGWGCQNNTAGSQSADTETRFDYSAFEQQPVEGNPDLTYVSRNNPQTGRVLEEGYLWKGKRFGTWITYHPEGGTGGRRMKTLTSYINDEVTGVYLEMNLQNRIDLQRYYTRNQLNGPHLTYNLGRLQEAANYRKGKLDGPYRKYQGMEKLTQSAEYKNGELDGIWRTYNQDGEILLEYKYENGRKLDGGIKQ